MTKNLLVPDIGDFEKVEIIEVLVKVGDKIISSKSGLSQIFRKIYNPP